MTHEELPEEILQSEVQDDAALEQKNKSLDRQLLRKADQLDALRQIYESGSSRKENWKKVKKASRYFKSSLYAIKDMDRSEDRPS